MPSLPLDRSNAWEMWSAGKVAATNLNIHVNSAPRWAVGSTQRNILGALAIKRNVNAIRLILTGSADQFSLGNDSDIVAIANNGWNSQTQTSHVDSYFGPTTYQQVADQISNILNECAALKIGVIFTVGYAVPGYSGNSASQGISHPDMGYKRDILIEFWKKTYAQWCLGYPALIGFDVLNEPGLAEADLYQHKSVAQIQSEPNLWPQFAQRIIQELRSFETEVLNIGTTPEMPPKMPLIVENCLNTDLGFAEFLTNNRQTKLISDNRIVYSYHHYDPGHLTHAGISGEPYFHMGLRYPLPGAYRRAYFDENGAVAWELRHYRNSNDIESSLSKIIEFKSVFGVPVFIGEFSISTSRMSEVRAPYAGANPAQFVSVVQNDNPTHAAILDKLCKVTSQSDYDNSGLTEDDTRYKVAHTRLRWITKISVDPDGSVRAFLGHLPANDKMRICVSPKTLTQLQPLLPSPVPTGSSAYTDPDPGFSTFNKSPVKNEFKHTVNATIQAGIGSVGQAFNMNAATVTITDGDDHIKFPAVAGISPGTTIEGAIVSFQDGTTLQLPVAVLWLYPSQSESEMMASRFNYLRDVLFTFQKNKLSWAWFCDDMNIATDLVTWRPTEAMSQLLSTAAAGIRLKLRT